VVLNAETVWRVAQIADRGAAWFRAQGLPEEPGPRLVTMGGAVPRPGVVETAAGASIASLLQSAGAQPTTSGTLLVGGLGGALLRADEAWQGEWSTRWLSTLGARPGPGVVHVLDPDDCPVDAVTAWLDYAAGESAGQCGPCMFGLPAVADDWRSLASGTQADRAARDRLVQRARSVSGRGACRLPDGVSGLVLSAVRVLADHLDDHAARRCSMRSRHHRRSDGHAVHASLAG
jgi:NADH:ubiquinone oxidoreductase subunit F (NADH-binding)